MAEEHDINTLTGQELDGEGVGSLSFWLGTGYLDGPQLRTPATLQRPTCNQAWSRFSKSNDVPVPGVRNHLETQTPLLLKLAMPGECLGSKGGNYGEQTVTARLQVMAGWGSGRA